MSKIDNAVTELDLEDTIDELIQRREQGDSLRELEEYYNREVIAATLDRADSSILTNIDLIKQALRGDLESSGKRIDVEETLSDMGIDPDELRNRLVTYETLRKYLKDRDVEPEKNSDPITIDRAEDTIEWSVNREEAIVERVLEQLSAADLVSYDDVEIDTSITITCTDTGESYLLEDFIKRGGC